MFITPGGIFGSNGNSYIRVSLCAKVEVIQEALERVASLTSLKRGLKNQIMKEKNNLSGGSKVLLFGEDLGGVTSPPSKGGIKKQQINENRKLKY